MKNTLNENIKKIRIEKNITQEQLGNFVGVNKATIQRYENGIISNIPSDKIEKIAKCLNVSPAYLMGWEDEEIEEINLNIPTTAMLFYDNICVNCSSPIIPEYTDIEVKEIALPNAILGDIAGKSNLVAIKSRGDSMDEIIPEGSLIIIQKLLPFQNVENGDIVMYSFEDCWSIKEFIKEKDRVIFRPHSTNPHHKDNIYKYDDMENGMDIPQIIGKVVYYGVSL